MAGTLTPAQVFDHELNPVKGWWDMHALDKRVTFDDSNSNTIQRGSVGHIHPTTKVFTLGLSNGYMPLFAFQGENDFDANSDVGNISGGVINTLVATGGYELETTEFVTGETYAPQTALKAAAAGNAGKVTPATSIQEDGVTIIGIVSEDGPITNDHSVQVVRFWPVFLPDRTA